MTQRIHIRMDSELRRRVRRRAAQMGVSLSEYLQSLVNRDLGKPRSAPDPSVVFNLGSSGGSDIARDKDEMLGDALAARLDRDRRRDFR